jgi:flagellar motor switch protein FliN
MTSLEQKARRKMQNELSVRLVKALANAAIEVLKQITGKERALEFLQEPPLLTGEKSRIEIVLRPDPRARIAVEFGENTSEYFARALVGEAVSDPVERKSAVEELWRQIAGRATTALGNTLQHGDLDVDATGVDSWSPVVSVATELGGADEAPLRLIVHLSNELLEFAQPEGVDSQAAGLRSPLPRSRPEEQNLELLLDVPLSLTLRFGQRRMPLREILQLTSGTVIELDRQAEEPVELFLDERVIARGHVVVVDGCYGLRVSEICSRHPSRGGKGVCA